MTEDCLKLTTYFGERHRIDGHFLADAQVDLFGRHGVASSILLRGAEGFGLKHHLRSDRLLSLSEDLPVVSVAIDTRPRVEAVLDELRTVQQTGLITLERARMLRGEIGPVALPEDLHEATKLTIYVGRRERVDRVPTFVAVCDLLHRHGVAGATVLLGVDGTRHGERKRARFFAGNVDVPMMIIAVGAGERIGRVLPELGALLARPLITLERVRVCKRDGQLVEPPHALPATDSHGMAMWQKLMIYTSEGALSDGRPVHRAIVQRAPPVRCPRRHRDTRRLGLRREPPSARRPPVPARPTGTGAHHRHRLTRADPGVLLDHRRPHARARCRDQRDGPRADRDDRDDAARRPSPRPTPLLA